MGVPDKVREKLRDLPDAPGCYLMRDARGRIIYVGKAASLRKRVRSYFRPGALRRGDPKLRSLVGSVADLDILVVRSEAEAILTEGRLIKEYKPHYNVSFRDDKRFLLLRADARQRLPRFSLCRIRREDGCVYFGPYASSPAARATLDFIEKQFGLRKCEPDSPDAETHRHCLNDIVRYCSAPCIGRVTAEAYRRSFEEACAFLAGERPAYIARLRERMTQAAADRRFEDAAALRDTLFSLAATIQQRARVAASPAMRAEDARQGIEELRQILGLGKAPGIIEGYDVSNISGTLSVASQVCAVDGLPARNRYRRFRIRTVEGSDDPAMMAEVIRRRFTRLRDGEGTPPDLVLVDGGITQLRAARAELARLGFAAVPAAGLAKRFEELYWTEGEAPILLPRDSRALQVLQRLRDEAHRFALLYHRTLRNRRIRESALDEIPGIGPRKKEQLLKRFGSVYRLARATAAEIGQAPGISAELARQIHEKLGAEAETPK